MERDAQVQRAEALGRADAREGREPLWYRVSEDAYVSAESGHIGNTELARAYLRGYRAEREVAS